jgi:hypothetical protein
MPTPVERAKALSADLRYLLRKHKARVSWREELDGRVTVVLVIEDAPWPRKVVAGLRERRGIVVDVIGGLLAVALGAFGSLIYHALTS